MRRLISLPLLVTLIVGSITVSAASRPRLHEPRFTQATEQVRAPLTLMNAWIDGHRHAHQDPALLAVDAVMEIAGVAPIHGRQPVVDVTDAFYGAIGGREITIEATVAAGDEASALIRVRGIQTGGMLGVPASGRRIDIEVMGFIDARDGQITRIRMMFDTLGLLRQIGAIPPAEAARVASSPLISLTNLALTRSIFDHTDGTRRRLDPPW